MNRVSFFLLAGCLTAIIGCGKPASSRSADVFMIDYARETGGAFYHGTFSLIGEKADGTWTIDRAGKKETRSVNLTEQTFRDIWNSLSEIEDFKKSALNGPGQALNPKTHHVIAIAFRTGGTEGMRTHLIPADGTSPAFKEWLGKLGYPGGTVSRGERGA